jgi:CRP-like cAMP-binding protein
VETDIRDGAELDDRTPVGASWCSPGSGIGANGSVDLHAETKEATVQSGAGHVLWPSGGASQPDELDGLPYRTLRTGEYILRRGSYLHSLYLVRVGRVALVRGEGKHRAILLIAGPGDVVGDVPALLRTPAPFDAVAISDVTVSVIVASRFRRAVESEPGFAQRWLLELAGRFAGCQDRLDGLLRGDLRSQVASLVMWESAQAGSLRFSQQIVAELLGVQRTSVCRVLRDLEREGIVNVGYASVSVVDWTALTKAAQSDH